jgi:hypothetical protein
MNFISRLERITEAHPAKPAFIFCGTYAKPCHEFRKFARIVLEIREHSCYSRLKDFG